MGEKVVETGFLIKSAQYIWMILKWNVKLFW